MGTGGGGGGGNRGRVVKEGSGEGRGEQGGEGGWGCIAYEENVAPTPANLCHTVHVTLGRRGGGGGGTSQHKIVEQLRGGERGVEGRGEVWLDIRCDYIA